MSYQCEVIKKKKKSNYNEWTKAHKWMFEEINSHCGLTNGSVWGFD